MSQKSSESSAPVRSGAPHVDHIWPNTVFSFEAEVQIVSGKTGRIRNEYDENSNVTSELKDGLQKIEVKVICLSKI